VSSAYRVLCLSHDPAVEVGEYTSPEAAEAAIRTDLSQHQGCDLLIGRYSYPLVEVGCPGRLGISVSGQRRCNGYHVHTKWIDSGWLRVLAHARHAASLPQGIDRHPDVSCWSEQRIWRLREELGLELLAPVDESSAEPVAVVHLEEEPQVGSARGVDEEPAYVLHTTAVLPSWRQEPDGTWSVPVAGAVLTAPAHISQARRDQLLFLLATSGPTAGSQPRTERDHA
jgi:hypothetical protein